MAALLLLGQAEAADAAKAEAHGCMGPTFELLEPQDRELSQEDLQQLGLVFKFEVAATVGQVRVHGSLSGQTCGMISSLLQRNDRVSGQTFQPGRLCCLDAYHASHRSPSTLGRILVLPCFVTLSTDPGSQVSAA